MTISAQTKHLQDAATAAANAAQVAARKNGFAVAAAAFAMFSLNFYRAQRREPTADEITAFMQTATVAYDGAPLMTDEAYRELLDRASSLAALTPKHARAAKVAG